LGSEEIKERLCKNEPIPDPNTILKAGFLVKQGHVRKNWKTRYFELTKTTLQYFESDIDGAPKGVIKLTPSLSIIIRPKSKKYLFEVINKKTKENKILLEAETEIMRDEWIEALNVAIGTRIIAKHLVANFDDTLPTRAHQKKKQEEEKEETEETEIIFLSKKYRIAQKY
jgi:hypothetical protein